MLSHGHFDLKCRLHVLACELNWGLNVDHWLVAVIISLFTVLSLCSGSAHTASCMTHIFHQLFPLFYFLFLFDPLCTSIYSLKDKGCVVGIIWNQVEKVRKYEPLFQWFLHCNEWFVSLMLVLKCKQYFHGLFRTKCFAFCFWSVAKCLPNTDCAQQWIKKGPLF